MRKYIPKMLDKYDTEIVHKYGKYPEYAQFYNKPDMFIYKNHLYFVSSGTSDRASFYSENDFVFELSVNTSLGYCGLTRHGNNASENIVFLQGDDYDTAESDFGIDFDYDSDKKIINKLFDLYY